jgi:hypothetical protein
MRALSRLSFFWIKMNTAGMGQFHLANQFAKALPPHGLGVFLLLSLQTLVYLICVFRLRIFLVVLAIVIIGGISRI